MLKLFLKFYLYHICSHKLIHIYSHKLIHIYSHRLIYIYSLRLIYTYSLRLLPRPGADTRAPRWRRSVSRGRCLHRTVRLRHHQSMRGIYFWPPRRRSWGTTVFTFISRYTLPWYSVLTLPLVLRAHPALVRPHRSQYRVSSMVTLRSTHPKYSMLTIQGTSRSPDPRYSMLIPYGSPSKLLRAHPI